MVEAVAGCRNTLPPLHTPLRPFPLHTHTHPPYTHPDMSVFVCRSARRSPSSAATRWWRLGARGCEGGSTPGESLKVRRQKQNFCKHIFNFEPFRLRGSRCVSLSPSGEPVSLRLCEAEEHADPLAHARPQRRDLRRALRELQSELHPGDDQV